MMLLWGCQNDKTSIQKITLSQPVTMLYFYIETCSECQSFKETAIPYLEETFGDSLTIQQYDLDDDTAQAVYEDVIDQLYQFDQSLYGMGPMYAIEGYFLFASFSLYSFLDNLASFLEIAPSATARIVNGLPALERPSMTFLMALMSYGISGRRIMSAPPAIPACRVTCPTLCPITSIINTRL